MKKSIVSSSSGSAGVGAGAGAEGICWYQCKICKYIGSSKNSKADLLSHERNKHGFYHPDGNKVIGISSSSIWSQLMEHNKKEIPFGLHVSKPNPVVAIPPILVPQVKDEPKEQEEKAKHILDQFIQDNPQKQKEKQMPKLTPSTVRTPQVKQVTPKPTPSRRKQPFTKLLSSSNDSEAQFSPPKVKKPLKTYGKSKWKRKSRAKPRLDFNDHVNDLNLRTPDGSVPFENFTITDNFRIIVNAGQKRVFVSKEVAAATSKVCEKCGFKGRTLTDLTDHARTHSKEKPFKCPVCPARFSRTQNMRHHIRLNCKAAKDLGLADKFQEKALLVEKRRQPIDSVGKADFSISCPHCIEKFNADSKLRNHLRVHTQGKNGLLLPCEFCLTLDTIKHNGFYSERALSDHKARLHNSSMDSSFKCKICGKNLSTSNSLRRHVTLYHKEAAAVAENEKTLKNGKKPQKRKRVRGGGPSSFLQSFQKERILENYEKVERTKLENYQKEKKAFIENEMKQRGGDSSLEFEIHGKDQEEEQRGGSSSSFIENQDRDHQIKQRGGSSSFMIHGEAARLGGTSFNDDDDDDDDDDDPNIHYNWTPKIIKVEHVDVLPLPEVKVTPQNHSFSSSSSSSSPKRIHVLKSYQDDHDHEQFDSYNHVQEPELVLLSSGRPDRNGGNIVSQQFIVGQDPLAF